MTWDRVMQSKTVRCLTAWILVVLCGLPLVGGDETRLVPSSAVVFIPAMVVNYVIQPAVRDDLKLTQEQQKRIADLQAELQALAPFAAGNGRATAEERAEQAERAQLQLIEILTPEQVRRHYQISLQDIL